MNGETMTVGELIETLKRHPKNMPVRFAYDYGDHVHSRVAEDINDASPESVKYSDYHNMHKVVAADDVDDDSKAEELHECLILSSGRL